MFLRYRLLTLAAAVLLFATSLRAQPFSVEAYRSFLEQNAGLTPEGLEKLHPIGSFLQSAAVRFDDALYADSIDRHYPLSAYERELIGRHGFMVTERQRWGSFGDAFMEIYQRDLPVFVSTDAILHAFHMSYDRILAEMEQAELIVRLRGILAEMHEQLPALQERYRSSVGIEPSLVDADIYLTVARRLLMGSFVPTMFPSSAADVDALMGLVAAEDAATFPLFGVTARDIDFSQFTPRGHYTRSEDLKQYFRAMIWLGRTEIYLTAPTSQTKFPEADIQRQTVLAALLVEAFESAGAADEYAAIEKAIASFVGEQDNATIDVVGRLLDEAGIASASDLLEVSRWKSFQAHFAASPASKQRILSQMLVRDPSLPIEPAGAMLLFGQRFIIDSYVFGNVVYDKTPTRRMLPSSLDALFALGNDAAAQLLLPELEAYRYAPQLASLRYLIDGYDQRDWQSSIYASWLNTIRALNPPTERTQLPRFQQTAAYWQQKMNTQLASWAQLRHDNLLYAKQSYSGIPGCSYPKSYVEPIPGFYRALAALAERAGEAIEATGFENSEVAKTYFDSVASTSRTLEAIAVKELAHEDLTSAEVDFLKRMIYSEHAGCAEQLSGWYTRLFFDLTGEDARKSDMVIADVHTSPADAEGNIVGWVMHVGTGPLDMAVMTCTTPAGETYAYVGPVMSYYEHVTSGFTRLTDEEWQKGWSAEGSVRPAWVNLYLADTNGSPRGEAPHLRYQVSSSAPVEESAEAIITSVHPNPSSDAVTIEFAVPPSLANRHVEVEVYDNTGALVRTLVAEILRSGDYAVRWEGVDASGSRVPAGTYHYRVAIGGVSAAGTIAFMPER